MSDVWSVCHHCRYPMLTWCRICAKHDDIEIDRLLNQYISTGRQEHAETPTGQPQRISRTTMYFDDLQAAATRTDLHYWRLINQQRGIA